MSEHIASPKSYVAIWLTLIVLTFVTWGVAFVDMGKFNIVVAMAIAVFKASLVALFFMHLKYSIQRTKIVMAASVIWLAILIGGVVMDYLTRQQFQL